MCTGLRARTAADIHKHQPHQTQSDCGDESQSVDLEVIQHGFQVNLAMTVIQTIGGYMFHSQALIADAMHGFTDLLADILTLLVASSTTKMPMLHDLVGKRRVEQLGSVFISTLLLLGGLSTMLNSLLSLCTLYMPQVALLNRLAAFHDHHSHEHGHDVPDSRAVWFALAQILVKEYLHRVTMQAAKKNKESPLLKTHAMHHRMDALTGIAALLSIIVSSAIPKLAGVDAASGLLISNIAIRAGVKNIRLALAPK